MQLNTKKKILLLPAVYIFLLFRFCDGTIDCPNGADEIMMFISNGNEVICKNK